MAEGTNFKFGEQIDEEEAYPKIAKIGQLGTTPGAHDLRLM